jgi:hypothetical protein
MSYSVTYRVYPPVTNSQFKALAEEKEYNGVLILQNIPDNDEVFEDASWDDANWYCDHLFSSDPNAPQAYLMTFEVLRGLDRLGEWAMTTMSEWIADRLYQGKEWYIAISFVGQQRYSEDPEWGYPVQFRCMTQQPE